MREALRGLTTRGRAFVAAGLTTVACAVLLGQPGLLRVGVLVVVVPLLAVVVVARAPFRLGLTRSVHPRQVGVGQPARVEIALANEGPTPRVALMLEDRLPYALGAGPRFVIDGVGPGWRRTVEYTVRSDVRGRYDLGPMTVRAGDPFGLVEVNRAFTGASALTVVPRVVALPSISLGGGWSGAGENRPRAFATGSAEDVTVREYRRGDDLRRVHWPSSARVDALMVRREEQPWQARATVLLDNRELAHRGAGAASSLEAAVTAAASVAAHLARHGFRVRLVTASGEEAGSAARHERSATLDVEPLLESLALVRPLPRAHLDSGWLGEHAFGGVTVAVLGAMLPADRPLLRRIQLDSDVALALALDADAWLDGREAHGSGREDVLRLAAQGWKTASLGPSTPLPSAWRELGRAAGAGRRDGSIDVAHLADVSGAARAGAAAERL